MESANFAREKEAKIDLVMNDLLGADPFEDANHRTYRTFLLRKFAARLVATFSAKDAIADIVRGLLKGYVHLGGGFAQAQKCVIENARSMLERVIIANSSLGEYSLDPDLDIESFVDVTVERLYEKVRSNGAFTSLMMMKGASHVREKECEQRMQAIAFVVPASDALLKVFKSIGMSVTAKNLQFYCGLLRYHANSGGGHVELRFLGNGAFTWSCLFCSSEIIITVTSCGTSSSVNSTSHPLPVIVDEDRTTESCVPVAAANSNDAVQHVDVVVDADQLGDDDDVGGAASVPVNRPAKRRRKSPFRVSCGGIYQHGNCCRTTMRYLDSHTDADVSAAYALLARCTRLMEPRQAGPASDSGSSESMANA